MQLSKFITPYPLMKDLINVTFLRIIVKHYDLMYVYESDLNRY